MKQVTKIFDNYQSLIDAIVAEGEQYVETINELIRQKEEMSKTEDGLKALDMKWMGVDDEGKVQFIPITPDMIKLPEELNDVVSEYERRADRRTRRRLLRKFKKISHG